MKWYGVKMQCSSQCLLFFFFTNILSGNCECNLAQKYFIKSVTGGLTVDGTEPSAVKVQYFTGYKPQQWRFECGTRMGLFYIVNQATETVLDTLERHNSTYVILNERDGSLYQQWSINSHGRIVNAGNGQFLDVASGYFVAGRRLQIYKENQTPAQQFVLDEQL